MNEERKRDYIELGKWRMGISGKPKSLPQVPHDFVFVDPHSDLCEDMLKELNKAEDNKEVT